MKSTENLGLTQTGDLLGTPQYMAPESFHSQYDARSEVYCLGLTLYELATLRPAYPETSAADLVRRITTESPILPRKLEPRIPRDLETVIQKAISRDPNARYQTAAELRDDLLAVGDDRPIAARKPSSTEQLARWSRQNPLAASLAVVSILLLVLLAAGASIGYLYAANANQRLSEKATSLALKQREAESAKQLALTNWERAEANVELTMKAFDDMFKAVISGDSKVQNEIDIDGFTELAGIETTVTAEDAERLKRLLTFYEQFTQQNTDNERLKTELARAYRRVANIYHLVGEFQPAVRAYQKAVDRYDDIRRSHPDSVADLMNLVRTKSEFSTALRSNGQPRLATQQIRQCVQLIDEHPQRETPDMQLEKAQILLAIGANNILLTASDNPLRRVPEAGPGLLARMANNLDPQVVQRLERIEQSRSLSDAMGQRRLEEVHQAIDIAQKLIAAQPDNADDLFTLAKGYSFLAAYLVMSDKLAADAALDQAISQFERLVKLFPDDLEYRYFMAITYSMNWNSDENNEDRIQLAQHCQRLGRQKSTRPGIQTAKSQGQLAERQNANGERKLGGSAPRFQRGQRRIGNAYHQEGQPGTRPRGSLFGRELSVTGPTLSKKGRTTPG